MTNIWFNQCLSELIKNMWSYANTWNIGSWICQGGQSLLRTISWNSLSIFCAFLTVLSCFMIPSPWGSQGWLLKPFLSQLPDPLLQCIQPTGNLPKSKHMHEVMYKAQNILWHLIQTKFPPAWAMGYQGSVRY